MKDTIFIRHIQDHLKDGQVVICKICGKTAEQIIKEEATDGEVAAEGEVRRPLLCPKHANQHHSSCTITSKDNCPRCREEEK